MAHIEIETLLHQNLGLKITSIGQLTVENAIRKRMLALGILEETAYVTYLKTSMFEVKELIEEVVVPETWFFRDEAAFEAMIGFVMKDWLPRHRDGMLKILSVPCSTGEEPYTIAIALLYAGWPAIRLSIDAIDISRRALARAEKGLYGEHSFRGSQLDFRQLFFERTEEGYLIRPAVRKKIRFLHGNILNRYFMENFGKYDIVFCRNLLIYLDAESQQHTITTLERLLNPEGLLFLGHAEAGVVHGGDLINVPFHQAFAFKKKTTTKRPDTTSSSEVIKSLALLVVPAAPPVEILAGREVAATARATAHLPRPSANDITLARQSADQGRLEEAARLCQDHLHEHGPSSQAYFLLGVIRNATGDMEGAMKYLRKTVYLEPEYMDALILLQLLSERLGDRIGAGALKKRIQRLEERQAQQGQAETH